MKKLSLIISLSMIALLISSFAMAQSTTGTNWIIATTAAASFSSGNVNAMSYIDSAASDVRGMAFNPVSLNVEYASRVVGNRVYVANGIDGTTTGMGWLGQGYLDNTTITPSGGTFVFNKVKVAGDGVIYCMNLTTGISGTVLNVYRWQTETTSIFLALSTTISTITVGARFGDGMGIVGSGVNTQILAGGSSSNGVLIFTTSDGSTFTLANQIPLVSPEATGVYDINPVAVNGNMWITASANHTRLWNTSGFSIDSLSGSVVSLGGKGCAYGTTGLGSTYLVVGQTPGGTQGQTFNVIDVTSGGTSAVIILATPANGFNNANGNGQGNTGFDAVHGNIFGLITDNLIGSYPVYQFGLPVELGSFEAKED